MIVRIRRIALACLLVLPVAAIPARGIQAADKPAKSRGAQVDEQRALLWRSLLKILPTKYKPIDAYGENASGSAVLLYSQGVTMMFSLESGKLEEIPMAKRLGPINCITFARTDDGGQWVMWLNGSREATIDERTTAKSDIAASAE